MEGFQQLKCEFTVVSVHIWMNGCPTNFSELPLGLSLLLERNTVEYEFYCTVPVRSCTPTGILVWYGTFSDR